MADLQRIRDQVTETLAASTRKMTPLETFAQIGNAAARTIKDPTVTFGDALNAMKAQKINAAKEMAEFLRAERSSELEEKRFGLEERRVGMEGERLGMERDRLGMEQERVGFDRERVGLDRARLGLEQRSADVQEGRLELDRAALQWQKLRDAAELGNSDAKMVADTIESLVPEDQRAIYAERLADLPEDVGPHNIVQAIGRVRRDLEVSGDLPQSEAKYTDEAGLRKEFTDLSEDFIKVRDSYNTILGLTDQLAPGGEYANPANAGPGDLSLIFAYMKMLDPGSTVREGEAATAENARGVPAGIMNTYNKILQGAVLAPEQRMGFVNQAESIFRKRGQFQRDLAEGFGGIAKRRGFDERNVVVDFFGPLGARSLDDEQLQEAIASATTEEELTALEAELDRRAGSL